MAQNGFSFQQRLVRWTVRHSAFRSGDCPRWVIGVALVSLLGASCAERQASPRGSAPQTIAASEAPSPAPRSYSRVNIGGVLKIQALIPAGWAHDTMSLGNNALLSFAASTQRAAVRSPDSSRRSLLPSSLAPKAAYILLSVADTRSIIEKYGILSVGRFPALHHSVSVGAFRMDDTFNGAPVHSYFALDRSTGALVSLLFWVGPRASKLLQRQAVYTVEHFSFQ